MFTFTLIVSLAWQGHVATYPVVEDAGFLPSLAAGSPAASGLATFFASKDTRIVPKGNLNSAAVAHSESWLARIVRTQVVPSSAVRTWSGRFGADGVSRLFVLPWRCSLGDITWSDNGVVAGIHLRLSQPRSVQSQAEARSLLDKLLSEMLNLPRVRADTIHWYLSDSGKRNGSRLYAWNVYRNLSTVPITLPNGDSAERITDPLQWHSALYVATDGPSFAVRINFRPEDENVLKRVADPRTRFKTK